jgi:peroxiredoxin Q/BCP
MVFIIKSSIEIFSEKIMKLAKVLSSLMFMFSSKPAMSAVLDVGSPAPQVTGIDQDDKKVDFADIYKKNKFVVVYFYPKADTPGCTAQACSLRDSYVDLQKRGVTVIGVSTDGEQDQKAFQKKYNLPFTLIADHDKKVVQAFGVPTMMGFAKRQAYLIEDGKIIWMDKEASTKEQAHDIMKVLEGKK